MCSPEDPLFTPPLQFARVLFQAKESVHKTPFWENIGNFSLYSLNFHPKLSSQAPKFGNSPFISPQMNFQFTSPPFQRQVSVRKPHTLEILAAHPYLKKVECSPPPPPPRASAKSLTETRVLVWYHAATILLLGLYLYHIYTRMNRIVWICRMWAHIKPAQPKIAVTSFPVLTEQRM